MTEKNSPFRRRLPTGSSSTADVRRGSKQARRARSTTGDGTVVQSGASAAGKWLVYGLIVLMGLGSLCGFLAFTRPAPSAQPVADPGVSTQQQEAGAFAQAYLSAWLTATSDDHAALDEYSPGAGAEIQGRSPISYRDLTVASVEDAPGNMTTVIVSASLETTDDEDGEEVTSWTPYWYQVAVQADGDTLAPVGLPTPVSMPATGSSPDLGYPGRVASRDLQATVDDFMTAYLTGQGDVTRVVSPESTITAITPAYWSQATVRTLASTEEITDSDPVDGRTAELLVDVDLTRDGTTKPAQYVLGMTVRDGRWEVQSLASAPALST
ncbi:conjugal transfer protein [Kocuria sp. M1N1S27]|uniref:conjugal transfer protein n=1 Tax=Kocuria kalidii TaxID=3376283 RepID=UPI0037A960E5